MNAHFTILCRVGILMQVVHLELFSDCQLFCPATGQLLVSETPFKPSSATLFSYFADTGEFNFISEEYRENFGATDEDPFPLEFSEFQWFLDSFSEPNSICFKVAQCGMSGASVALTVFIGIRMNYGHDEGF